MFDRIRALLAGTMSELESESELRISVASLLAEAACVDGQFDERERTKIAALLSQRFGLSHEESERLLDAGERAERSSLHIYRFTHLLVQHLGVERRIEIIEMLWEVAYADGNPDPDEDMLIGKIAGLLYVTDRERGTARRRVLKLNESLTN